MFRRVSDRIVVVVALLVAVAPSNGTRAAPPTSSSSASSASTSAPTKTAEEIKKEGDAAFDAFLYADALRAYEQAYALSHDPALLYNRGRALQALGRYPEALTMLERFGDEAPPSLRAKVPGLASLIASVRARVAVLQVVCNVDGAQIIVGDRIVGETGKTAEIRLAAQTTIVTVQHEGYFAVKREVALDGGATTKVSVKLLPRATSGVLAIVSEPTGATVTIDGTTEGAAPLEVVLPAGTHDIELAHGGYEPLRSKVVVDADARVEVRRTLEETPPITSRWWFWTGVGVVVVSGVVVGWALTHDRSAPNGTFSPGTVSAPLYRF